MKLDPITKATFKYTQIDIVLVEFVIFNEIINGVNKMLMSMIFNLLLYI